MAPDDKLLEKMRRSKAGWTCDDLDELYISHGFEMREGGKHRIYIHPKFSELRATVTRSRSLPIGYITTAIKLIDKLCEMEQQHEEG